MVQFQFRNRETVGNQECFPINPLFLFSFSEKVFDRDLALLSWSYKSKSCWTWEESNVVCQRFFKKFKVFQSISWISKYLMNFIVVWRLLVHTYRGRGLKKSILVLFFFFSFNTLYHHLLSNGILKCWMFHDFFLIRSLLIEPLLRSGPLTIDPGVMVVKTINIQFPSSFFCLGPLLFKLELICGFISWGIKCLEIPAYPLSKREVNIWSNSSLGITFFSQCCYV